jgi:hypothetical protein
VCVAALGALVDLIAAPKPGLRHRSLFLPLHALFNIDF